MPQAQRSLPLWLLLWSVLLALGWVLPNHYRPWTAFHSEIWVAFVLLALLPPAILKLPKQFSGDAFAVVVLAAAAVPFVQLVIGQIAFFGQAWISSLYLIGFLVAILAGQAWERLFPDRLVDMLCLAVGIAALLSVFLQLRQWLGLNGLGIWLVESTDVRPAANLGQPNQLATLLLWGTLATFWAWARAKIGVAVAVILALILLFGVALTASRTAWLAVWLVIAVAWWWRAIWKSKYVPWLLTVLGLVFSLCVLILDFSGSHSRLAQMAVTTTSTVSPGSMRISGWLHLAQAILERPFFGYGWAQTAKAYILVSESAPALHTIFGAAHNLFLDLVLWCGLPVGGLLSWIVLRKFWQMFRQVNSPEKAVLFFFLLVVANHALLELPLHYAYFLLPVGLVLGTFLAYDPQFKPILKIGKIGFSVLGLVSAAMLSITLVDYLKVENSYALLRFEWAGYKLASNPQPPNLIALNQWHGIIKHARAVPKAGMPAAELEEMRQITLLAHKPIDFRVLARSLALNGKIAESDLWLKRLCNVGTAQSCSVVDNDAGQQE